jgi:predicted enzyme related to lactoylglutathione lyase
MKSTAFLGLRTAIYYVPDLARAKDWYRELLGVDPYYDSPYYVGFNVAGFELGLHPASDTKKPGPGVETYWGVASMDEAWARITAAGAKGVDPPHDVGEGILVAAVADPFGNVIGLIQNPHFPNEA